METPRLSIRPFQTTDLDALAEIVADELTAGRFLYKRRSLLLLHRFRFCGKSDKLRKAS
jgi:hypothetical protein